MRASITCHANRLGPNVEVHRRREVGWPALVPALVALCTLTLPQGAQSQQPIELKVEVASDMVVPHAEIPSRNASFTVPGAGRMRITYRQLKYRGYSPSGGYVFTFPGNAVGALPGRNVSGTINPGSPVEGMPWEAVWVQQFDGSAANLKIGVGLGALGYQQSTGDPPLFHIYAQSTSLSVQWLGSADDTSEDPQSPPIQQPGLEGRWALNANGSGGWLEIENQQIKIDGIEPITNVSFDPSTGQISFDRPLQHLGEQFYQRYSGVVSGGEIQGTFTQGGTGNYLWCASSSGTCTPSAPAVVPPAGPANPPPPSSPASPPQETSQATTGMTLRAESRKVKSGETVTLPIWLDQAAGVANMNFTVLYDSNVVQAVDVTRGAFVPGRTLYEANSGQAGTVRIGLADSRDLSGTGPVAQIAFRAVGRPGSRTPIRLQVTTLSDAANAQPSIQTVNGLVEVVAEDALVPGDANGNGVLDAGDALEALKMSVGLIAEKRNCDLDQDGQVTSTDARLILQRVVGK